MSGSSTEPILTKAPASFVCFNLGFSANVIEGRHFKGGFCTNFLRSHWVRYEQLGTGLGLELAADIFYMRSSTNENTAGSYGCVGFTSAAIVGAEYTECESTDSARGNTLYVFGLKIGAAANLKGFHIQIL
ncbi:MAG: hypothetical protein HC902_03715 [Calothrix sp. SM1_5_4]|nr:hypothetical protein [Calothrix sp. SM1_5_4]